MDRDANNDRNGGTVETEGSGQQNPFAAPSVALPKGGGAIRGIGEKFAANPVTGTGSLTVPIATTPGRSGFGPKLSLSYDSGSGNGPFGFGWRMSVPSITRKTDKGLPRYFDDEESDVFILSGAEDLVPELRQPPAADSVGAQPGGSWVYDTNSPVVLQGQSYTVRHYRPRIEGLFARIERWTNLATGETFWKSISKDNVTSLYGWDASSRIADPANPSRVYSWLLALTYDDRGNVALYTYKPEDSTNVTPAVQEQHRTIGANRYLKSIQYGNRTPYAPGGAPVLPTNDTMNWCFNVVFDYGEHNPSAPTPTEITGWLCRLDPFSTYRPCFEVRTYRLCRRVLMFHNFPNELSIPHYLVRSTHFHYSSDDSPPDPVSPIYTYLESVTQSGHSWDSTNSKYIKKSLPPLDFRYTQARINPTVHDADPSAVQNLPAGVDGSRYRWADLDGEGSPGILTEQAGSWFYKRNISNCPDTAGRVRARFEALECVASMPSLADLRGGAQQLMDLAGDGHLSLVQCTPPIAGFYERTEDHGWSAFVAFRQVPNIDWRDPNLRTVDLNGDGFPDVLITEHEVLTWYPSWARGGFGPAQTCRKPFDEDAGPAVVFADGTQSIYVADMSGDGLQDLVRIRNGEICYWPNLGYGRFGAKITMGNAPVFDRPDLFDQKRVRLADIDGSGTTDVLYLGSDSVRAWFNQSGNAWSTPQAISAFPQIDDLASVTTVDLLGNGTACLVWSSGLPGDAQQPLRYIDLMGRQKPHLLVDMRNNLGAETRIHYVPSTKFYLRDRERGEPWVTRLAFPVQVVERVETFDWISRNRFISRYSYHHGYFDGAEREFRGFGRVDQIDTEELGALSASGAFPPATNVDAASYVPPVLTKTWFHTGAYPMGGRVSRVYAHEYYQEPGLSPSRLAAIELPDSVLPDSLTGRELREAIRALKGSVLRQEIYALDGTAAATLPYSVSEKNYTVRRVQPMLGDRHAVFYTHARETIDFHYERALYSVTGVSAPVADPRVSHSLVLAVDDYGNELQTVSISYGRRYPEPASNSQSLLNATDQATQGNTLATYTQNDYTNPIHTADTHRTPLIAESRTYELINVAPSSSVSGVTNLFTFPDFLGDQNNTGLLAQASQNDLNYEDIDATQAPPGQPCRRILADRRVLYLSDDLSGPLPLGTIQPRALPYETYERALTPGLITSVFQGSLAGQAGQTLIPNPASVLAGAGGGSPIDPYNNQQGGYVDLDGTGNWWIPTGRVRYSPDDSSVELTFAQSHFFLPHRFIDPFQEALNAANVIGGAAVPLVTTVSYDENDLLVVATIDPRGNQITVGYRYADGSTTNGNDYRVMQPGLITDANGNCSAAQFDTLGLVVATAVMGKTTDSPAVGDNFTGFDPEADTTAFLTNPGGTAATLAASAATLLVNATTRMVYDLDRFQTTQAANPNDPTRWEPVAAATIAREIHVSQLTVPSTSRLQINFSYSDGFQRVIQTKLLAEPGPIPPGNTAVTPRWLGSGWTVYNNKGKPVRQYEPFFSATQDFEFEAIAGVSPILFYDPVGRVVATLHPDQSWEKVVFDPWHQETSDGNDTVLIPGSSSPDPSKDTDVGIYFQRIPQADYLPTWYTQNINGTASQQDAAQKAATCSATPSLAYFDSLGRTILSIADNGLDATGTPQKYATRTELDIQGYQRSVTDALGRTIMRYDYDMLGTKLHSNSLDAGERWMLNDVNGKPLLGWNSRGFATTRTYDELRRQTGLKVLASGATSPALAEKLVYGDDPSVSSPQPFNLRGKIYQSYDAAGLVKNTLYDFKGNLLSDVRTLLTASLQNLGSLIDWSASTPPTLDTESFTTSTAYDALNRAISQTTPDGSVVARLYNQTKLLQSVNLTPPGASNLSVVSNIDYNEKNQRLSIQYGNGAQIAYTYEADTYRLMRINTTRPQSANGFSSTLFQVPTTIQDLSYTYDPVGNITQLVDNALATVYYNNQSISPLLNYTYDPVYRLISAEGRESIGQSALTTAVANGNLRDYPFVGLAAGPGDLQALQNYTETYAYDAVGDFQTLKHSVMNGGWTRQYWYSSNAGPGLNNQLWSTSLPGNTTTPGSVAQYSHDLDGNMTAMPQLPVMQWDFKDQLQMTRQQVNNSGPVPSTYYVYDAGGRRVRKATLSAGGTLASERLYVEGYEVYREYGTNRVTTTLERQTLHIMDDKQRVAMAENKSIDTGGSPDTSPTLRYQFTNHLGSALLELDQNATLISYEEYYPYGSTSFQAVNSVVEVSAKRYRYTGKERDEESGLSHHEARYYTPWLGRWISCDPKGLVDGTNLYVYARNNPVCRTDQTGTQSDVSLGQKLWLQTQEPLTPTTTAYLHSMLPKTYPSVEAREAPHTSSFKTFLEEVRDFIAHSNTFKAEDILQKRDVEVAQSHFNPSAVEFGAPSLMQLVGHEGSLLQRNMAASGSLAEVGLGISNSFLDWASGEAEITFGPKILRQGFAVYEYFKGVKEGSEAILGHSLITGEPISTKERSEHLTDLLLHVSIPEEGEGGFPLLPAVKDLIDSLSPDEPPKESESGKSRDVQKGEGPVTNPGQERALQPVFRDAPEDHGLIVRPLM